MKRSIRDALLVCAAPLLVLVVGLTTVVGGQSTTDADGRTTSSGGLTDTPALIVYATTLATLAVSVLVLRRIRHRQDTT
ncbi:hypothetical protein [Streptomyces botrytidirepellens]|uniref:Uncharacterized protein n=1 Tax=Streptomyces botrytidirepellens TaxID=2486417 RepID=A0A3M8VN56_9ACTN|nr:hypothetical protein [Streptomyces botrytidirepellens]RNG18169.1 hypothetical protein EEJ42_27640 [Streptomyces botrytidirepellens]